LPNNQARRRLPRIRSHTRSKGGRRGVASLVLPPLPYGRSETNTAESNTPVYGTAYSLSCCRPVDYGILANADNLSTLRRPVLLGLRRPRDNVWCADELISIREGRSRPAALPLSPCRAEQAPSVPAVACTPGRPPLLPVSVEPIGGHRPDSPAADRGRSLMERGAVPPHDSPRDQCGCASSKGLPAGRLAMTLAK
jgi:hypothetical protein